MSCVVSTGQGKEGKQDHELTLPSTTLFININSFKIEKLGLHRGGENVFPGGGEEEMSHQHMRTASSAL